ncbi:hypothetical protein EDC59_102279 [Pseudodesulfovibrio indicus]|uniref:Uncharacterized protein n=1 Tax=Pseudodesulfovibrio indicus TaxID=1716143 RepID=A0AA94TK36_9BACT|nr:hypothetical protein EDC59_102279 [Pseudodesulfovibrio indicus]
MAPCLTTSAKVLIPVAASFRRYSKIGLVLAICLLMASATGQVHRLSHQFGHNLAARALSVDTGPLVSLADLGDTDNGEDDLHHVLSVEAWCFIPSLPPHGSHGFFSLAATLLPNSEEHLSRFLPRPPPLG